MWQTKKNVPPSKKWLLLKEDFLGEEIKVFLLIVYSFDMCLYLYNLVNIGFMM